MQLCQCEELAGEPLTLSYHTPQVPQEELKHYFCKQFAKHRRRESELGMTLSGPHRDDLTILLRGKDARHFASEGEQRSCIAALKLAQWKWLETRVDQTPLFCVDDVGISFDSFRESALYKRMEQLGQVFITHLHPALLHSHSLHINNGKIC